MKRHHIVSVILRGNLIWLCSRCILERSSLRMEPDVLVAELQNHRLVSGERERDQPHPLVRVLGLGHIRKPRTVLDGPLGQADKIPANL